MEDAVVEIAIKVNGKTKITNFIVGMIQMGKDQLWKNMKGKKDD